MEPVKQMIMSVGFIIIGLLILYCGASITQGIVAMESVEKATALNMVASYAKTLHMQDSGIVELSFIKPIKLEVGENYIAYDGKKKEVGFRMAPAEINSKKITITKTGEIMEIRGAE